MSAGRRRACRRAAGRIVELGPWFDLFDSSPEADRGRRRTSTIRKFRVLIVLVVVLRPRFPYHQWAENEDDPTTTSTIRKFRVLIVLVVVVVLDSSISLPPADRGRQDDNDDEHDQEIPAF